MEKGSRPFEGERAENGMGDVIIGAAAGRFIVREETVFFIHSHKRPLKRPDQFWNKSAVRPS
jgi:hypothetical protein